MKSSSLSLSLWQKKQATLLYHFASLAYLKSVKERIDTLLASSNSTLDAAARKNRNARLKSQRRGHRDTSKNSGNNAWACLANFQRGLAEDIANRSVEAYAVTGRNNCARSLAESSMEWTTPGEQATYDDLFANACARAADIDLTMNRLAPESHWSDYVLTMRWKKHEKEFPRIPKLRVREDVFAQTGAVPVRTGVYFCADDPNAALQFAWTGGGGGKLLESCTFNALGEAALAAVGRAQLWLDGDAMLKFVKANQNSRLLRADSFFEDSQTAALAPSLVARQAFIGKPCKWYFVEMIADEFEEITEEDQPAAGAATSALRFEAGATCSVAGVYFTPARQNSRRPFKVGDVFPDEASGYGATFWQLDEQQDGKQN